MTPSLDEQIAAVTREIAIREAVYPKLVETGKMKKQKAEHEIACMKAVLGTLMEVSIIGSYTGELATLTVAAPSAVPATQE
jgi:hypothetical protein